MKLLLTILCCIGLALTTAAQKKQAPAPKKTDSAVVKKPVFPKPTSPKPYKEVIPDSAKTVRGLFIVHQVGDKWYFELPDSLLNREILAVTRFSKAPAGSRSYGGEEVNEQTFRWEKGPSDVVFMRVMTVVSLAKDSSEPIAKAVHNSNLDPIAAAFDIKAYGKDSSLVIDVTDFFKGDNQPVSLTPAIKRQYSLGGLSGDRSYIAFIHSFPLNTEVRTVKTYSSSPAPAGISFGPAAGVSLPAAEAAGAVTIELNNSFILLPAIPMRKRMYDKRVGYFASDYTVYSDDQQKVKTETFIHHWRLEPRDEDREKWLRGELVEPKKPIVYYIDPATPKQWRPYLIAGINDWQAAFEQAGFKNAIIGKEWPENDSTMSLDDARYSVIRYFASDIENAYGPNIADPRSGEILESHVGWYHNVMKLLHDWYMIQTGAVDPRARTMKFDDSLMGQLVRFVSSHEIGHTLGLRHNMGSSSLTPVEKLRDKAWVEAHGHTASIMDYARFNYVAQPEDKIGPAGLYPRIGEYDRWAIQWGYKGIPNTPDAEADKKVLNRWIVDSLKSNPRLWFGGEGRSFDPRAQTEDLGDNSMKASEYGIKNLKRILPQLPVWTKEEADTYDNLGDLYVQLTIQFGRYMNHVAKNVGGIYETFKSVEQDGDVYAPAPKAIQQSAVAFLHAQLFETPSWLLDKNILNKISSPSSTENVINTQSSVLHTLLSSSLMYRMSKLTERYGAASYAPDELVTDLEKGIWKELNNHSAIDAYRRNLQKDYVESLIALMNPQQPSMPANLPRGLVLIFGGDIKNTDIPSIARAHLVALRKRILATAPLTADKLSRYHLEDVAERIRLAMEPK
ncbi:MAG TPA: zinc-dependent metalloprotease [Puia sp.]|nr:zinc-dependent metalloprotease [Puia sp.]